MLAANITTLIDSLPPSRIRAGIIMYSRKFKCTDRLLYYRTVTAPRFISSQQVQKIKQYRRKGWTYQQIADKTQLSIATAWAYARRVV